MRYQYGSRRHTLRVVGSVPLLIMKGGISMPIAVIISIGLLKRSGSHLEIIQKIACKIAGLLLITGGVVQEYTTGGTIA